jgi:pimeloyl-ACP methyl ester carboxylesterase
MATRKPKNMKDYLEPLNINGLQGRMLRVPAPKGKNREILFIYGHHASLERMFGFAEALSRYGSVTMPDLPGFGGMESFYKLGMKPSIDNLADYLAAFIKLRYKRQKITLIGISFGFVVVTRMLQKYPEIAQRAELVVSIVGFVHKDDFIFKRHNFYLVRYVSSLFSNRFPAWLFKNLALRPLFIRTTYKLVADKHVKLKDASIEERDRRIDFEIMLWHINDVRTYMDVTVSMLTLDLCQEQIDLPVYQITVMPDHFFDHKIVEQHLRVIYTDSEEIKSKMSGHSQTVIATAKDVAPFFPPKFRRILASK